MLPLLLTLLSGSPCPAELFRIERNKNANVVVYEAHAGRATPLDPKEPVTASWLLLASKGEREALGFFEKTMAYGFEVHPASAVPGFELTLHAVKSRVIHVAVENGCPAALSTIGGRSGALKRIYVKADERSLVPTVQSVELFGVDAVTGEPLYEKLTP